MIQWFIHRNEILHALISIVQEQLQTPLWSCDTISLFSSFTHTLIECAFNVSNLNNFHSAIFQHDDVHFIGKFFICFK